MDIQQKQMHQEQIHHLEQHIQALENQRMELQLSSQALIDLKSMKENDELLVSIGPGIFVKAKLANNKEVALNVGAQCVVVKEIDDGKKLLDNQINEIKKMITDYVKEIENIMLLVNEDSKNV